jgi:hypothetical protein
MLLEEIRNIKATTKEVRKFGLTIGLLLLVITGVLFWRERPTYAYFLYASLTFAILGLNLPLLLRPIYRAWMTVAVIMGFVMNRVILTSLFFGLFTPMSLIARLMGKDLLKERIDKQASSYWIRRVPQKYDPKTAERMF